MRIKYYALREAEQEKEVKLIHCPTEFQLADILTKALPKSRFEFLRLKLGMMAKSLKEEYVKSGRVMGRGALSYVFRGRVGFLRTAVAVKRLDKEDKENTKAFCRELMIVSSLERPNVVPLLGFCIDPEEGLFLVYKYVSSGSLERHLHGKKKSGKGFASLSWSARYKVAVGIAEAIAYLHNGTEKCIVHRDINPSNIFLSSKKRPKLCDFGLATWTAAPSVPFLCKTVKGTFKYLAPEYFQHGKVTDKTDVYAFGVVLLEFITGRKPIESSRPSGEENLVQWVCDITLPILLCDRQERALNVRFPCPGQMIVPIAELQNKKVADR
ncbi:probable serine/threonine-protein kinase PBL7 [Chenopodium quinoa]|uniref:probable serine/threonine-protein kinase PBL7 n=1 Tax=Chenopodium quinoa TaxID=63459 RepID=UPI000B781946|nr:probable serine/threonine-protein kinase PBL7 [Chenopodium quinoa]